jgi:hypothetical protein
MGSITAIADVIAKGNKGTDRLFIDSRPGETRAGSHLSYFEGKGSFYWREGY